MKSILFLLLIPISTFSVPGCVNPTPNAGYYAISPAHAEANRRNTHRVEQEARDMNHIERMRRAEATELSTRNMPDSISTTTVYSPRFLWW